MTAGDARTLGFVGLGVMGAPMARRLLDAGDRVLVHDIDVAAMDALADAGAHPCPHARGGRRRRDRVGQPAVTAAASPEHGAVA